MKRSLPILLALQLALVALLLGSVAPATWADDDEDDDAEIPFSVANVFFELNDTDGDLGIHALIDGDPWKRLAIENSDESENLQIRLKGSMRVHGLTELFFESAEPTFDDLDPEEFFDRFPEGTYEVEGTTIEGDEMESTSMVTHLIPAPAENFEVNGTPVPDGCEDEPFPGVSAPLSITWDEVTHSHSELGRTNEPIEIANYEIVVEREEPTELNFTVIVPSDTTSLTFPSGLISAGEEIKVSILVEEDSGNQTGIEGCFNVE